MILPGDSLIFTTGVATMRAQCVRKSIIVICGPHMPARPACEAAIPEDCVTVIDFVTTLPQWKQLR